MDDYLASIPDASREAFLKLRSLVRATVPARAEEVISYGVPAFRDNKVLVWFAAFEQHVSLFPTAAVIAQFREELSGHKVSKGTVQFALTKPLPAALIRRLVKARIASAK